MTAWATVPYTVEPLLTDTSLIQTVHLVPGKCPYTLCKNNLYNTDNGHEISAPERKFIQTEPLYYGHSNDDSSYSTRFPVCRYISECNQLSHCSYDNSIMFSIGKNYTIDMSLPFIIKISYSLKIISKAQSLYVKKRLANAVQKNITDFFNAK